MGGTFVDVAVQSGTLSAVAWGVLLYLWLDAFRQLRRTQGRFEDLPAEARVAGVREALLPAIRVGRTQFLLGLGLALVAGVLLLRGFAQLLAGLPVMRLEALALTETGRVFSAGLYVLVLANFAAFEGLNARLRRSRAEEFMRSRGGAWRGTLARLFDARNRRDPALPDVREQVSVTTPFPGDPGEGAWDRLEFLQLVPAERLVVVSAPALELAPEYLRAAEDPEHVPVLDLQARSIRLVGFEEVVHVEFRRVPAPADPEVDRGHLTLTLLSGETLRHEVAPASGEHLLRMIRDRVLQAGVADLRSLAPTSPSPAGRHPCPMCAEEILEAARICRFCSHPVDQRLRRSA